ncbi:MAG: NADH-quinone oxidoreductase subunit 5 family protein [Egibacteraceae bacterium]
MTTAVALWLVVLGPLVIGPLLWAGGARLRKAARSRLLGTVAGVGLSATLLGAIAAAVADVGAEFAWGDGLVLTLSAVDVAGVVAVLVPTVGLPVVAYAAVHEDAAGLPRLLGLLVAFVGAMELLVLAADLLTLLIAWELVAALSWALIGFSWGDPDNVRRAAHAFHATRAGSVGLFLAAGAALAGTGSLAYADLHALDGALLDVAAAGILLAAASKSAQLPFSPWLFSAMAGPTPVSALLHSATMVAAGAYALVRLAAPLSDTGWFLPAVLTTGLATALWGGVVALAETHGKRILAASTAAQYGLMFAAVGAGAAAAAAAHLVTHALLKSLLFLAVGVGLHATGTADVRTWRLGRRMPHVAAAAGVGALALAAVPPLGAAWSKEQIVAAMVHAGPLVGGLVLLAGLLSAAYAARLQLLAFGRGGAVAAADGLTGDDGRSRPVRPPPAELVALGVLAVGSVLLGLLWWPGSAELVEELAGASLRAGTAVEVAGSLALVLAGLAWAWTRNRRGRDNAMVPATLTMAASGWFGLATASRRAVVDPLLAMASAFARFDDVVVDAPVRWVGNVGAAVARTLPRFDDAVIDGVVRQVSRLGRLTSRALGWWVERGVDGVVVVLAAVTEWMGRVSRVGDDRGVDGAVEGIAEAVGIAGARTRHLQTGLAHHYYVIAAVGLIALLTVAAVGR